MEGLSVILWVGLGCFSFFLPVVVAALALSGEDCGH
jgi:hypothetical protein